MNGLIRGLLTQTDLLAESAVTRLIFLSLRTSRRTHLCIFYPAHDLVLLPLARTRVPILTLPSASMHAVSFVSRDTCILGFVLL